MDESSELRLFMKKLVINIFLLSLANTAFGAACGQTAFNPFTGKLDCVGTSGGAGGTPGGSPSQLQFNNNGSFGGADYSSSTTKGLILTATASANTPLIVVKATDTTVYNSFSVFPTSAGLRNNGTFTLGYYFNVNTNLTVTSLSRFYVDSNTQNHPVGIWDFGSGTLIASCTVLAASASDSNGMKYCTTSPAVLGGPNLYVIGVEEFDTGDQWVDAHETKNTFSPQIQRFGTTYVIGSFSIPLISNNLDGTQVYSSAGFKFTTDTSYPFEVAHDTSNFALEGISSNGSMSLVLNKSDQLFSIGGALAVGKATPATGYELGVAGSAEVTSAKISLLSFFGSAGASFTIGQNSSAPLPNLRFDNGGNVAINANSSSYGLLFGFDDPVTSKVAIGQVQPLAQLHVLTPRTDRIAEIIQASAGQTANVEEFWNSSNVVISSMDANGNLTVSTMTAMNAIRSNGALSFQGANPLLLNYETGGAGAGPFGNNNAAAFIFAQTQGGAIPSDIEIVASTTPYSTVKAFANYGTGYTQNPDLCGFSIIPRYNFIGIQHGSIVFYCEGLSIFSLASNSLTFNSTSSFTNSITANNGAKIYSQTSNAYALVVSTSSAGQNFIDVSTNGYVSMRAPAPTLGTCGSASTLNSIASDNHGTVAISGTLVTSCALVWAIPKNNIPDCAISSNSTTLTVDAIPTKTGITFGISAGVSSLNVTYICIGGD